MLSDEDIQSDDELEVPRISNTHPSFPYSSTKRTKPSRSIYESPIKSRASTNVTPDPQPISAHNPNRPVCASCLKRQTRPGSPLWIRSEQGLFEDSALGGRQHTERFLYRGGVSTDTFDSETTCAPHSLHRSPNPPRRAILFEAEEDFPRPQLRWCPFCRREVTTCRLLHPSRNT